MMMNQKLLVLLLIRQRANDKNRFCLQQYHNTTPSHDSAVVTTKFTTEYS